MVLNKNDIWKFGTLSVSPFDWLEAGYFYYRPSDLIWDGNNVKGHFLDKGFNIKFIYRSKNNNIPNIAIGLDDFAGTGFFTREYIVSTKDFDNTKISLGIGWGKYAGKNSFKNPLINISDAFNTRPAISDNYNLGGSLSYDKWFRGNAAIFGGIEYTISKKRGYKLKLEYDPYNYFDFSANNRSEAIYNVRKKDSNVNIGFSFPINNFLTIDTSFIKGNTFNISFAFGLTFNKDLSSKPKFKPNIENKDSSKSTSFYEDLLFNLNNNMLFLQTSTLDDNDNLDISISNSEYRNAIRSSSYAANIANEIAIQNEIDLKFINVTHINAGIELNNITYVADYYDDKSNHPVELKIRTTVLDSGEPNEFLTDEFQPTINFPLIFSSISPTLVSHIGNPEKFYFGGINISYFSEVQFSRNLLLTSELAVPVYSTFKDTVGGSQSLMKHVRTDLVQYLKEDDMHIARMQLDYLWSPNKDLYAKISGGMFEPMFGGICAQVLYRPFNGNFSIGADIFHVKQRTFAKRFEFQKYETTTGHINIGYKFLKGIESNLSYGRYLAKDDGFTFDLGRRTRSGFKAGIYFTRTNVSAELFGEGSFDKGFYFQIPMDLLLNRYTGNYSTFKLSPMTRDGGAKLIYDKDLNGLIFNSTFIELNNQWIDYIN